MRIIQTLDTNQIQLDPEYILVRAFYVGKKKFLRVKHDFIFRSRFCFKYVMSSKVQKIL